MLNQTHMRKFFASAMAAIVAAAVIMPVTADARGKGHRGGRHHSSFNRHHSHRPYSHFCWAAELKAGTCSNDHP